MSELNDARKHKDLQRVQAILKKLQTGLGFDVASDEQCFLRS
jgi:flagellin-specific chaperone FliS